MDQSEAPVLEALTEYRRNHEVSFSPPGHRQGLGADERAAAVLGMATYTADVVASELGPDGGAEVLARAEELMAQAVGADHAFFSTCGSSLSVKAAMLAAARPGHKLLIGRDVHKSVASGLVLSGIRPVWVEPAWDAERHLAHPPLPESFAAAFEEHPDAAGAFVTSPTPYGACADLAAIVELCHSRGKPLVVDEAWGAHLPFHPDLPPWAMNVGADVCVTSVHKMGAGLEQSSVFHLQGDLIGAETLRSRGDLLDTTSPSVLIYAALDGWRRQMVERGRDLLTAALELAIGVRTDIEALDGFHVNGRDDFCGPGAAFDLDPLQVVIDLTGLGITGYQAADWLREHEHIDLHLTDHRRISAQLSFAETPGRARELVRALGRLGEAAATMSRGAEVYVPSPSRLRLEQAMTPREAYFADSEAVPVAEAAGRVCTEILTPYPPGIAAVLPGERLDEEVLDYLRTGLEAGMNIPDAADPKLETVRVVAGGGGGGGGASRTPRVR